MQQSTERILTTHTGSLPRPPSLQDLLYARDQGEAVDQAVFEGQVREAVNAVVRQQASCGLDIINDGEMSKITYATYIKDRLSGFEEIGGMPNLQGADLLEFPEYAQRMFAATPLSRLRYPSCTGPITYTATEHLPHHLQHLQPPLHGGHPPAAIMN